MIRPSFSPEAALVVAGEGSLHPGWEHAFACEWDSATRRITRATLTCRGNSRQTALFQGDLKPGMLFLHSHPGGSLEASDLDFNALHTIAPLGIGFAICTPDASGLFVMREPLLPWAFREPRGPAMRIKRWSWWRFELWYSTQEK